MPESAEAKTSTGGQNSSVSLKSYLAGIGAVVKKLPAAWVRCELHQIKVGDRFVRMEFIELDEHGKQIARAQGGCWPGVWRRISAAFEAAGLPLEEGSQVLVQLDAQLDATFGFQVAVLDIDLTFALGDLKARIQAIRRHLHDAGIFDRNRLLPRPNDFLRVAVISPTGAAGLGDFRSTADRLQSAGLTEFVYYEAPFQTREAPVRIVEVLRTLYRQCSTGAGYCAVAIIRGGGASADLAWLVDQKLAEAVCRMNVPVMTGIGHERDRNLLDEVACMPCDTPSKVAELISTTITRSATDARYAFGLIQSQSMQALDRDQASLSNLQNAIDRDAKESARLADVVVREAAIGLEPGARQLIDETKAAVVSASEEVRNSARQAREAAHNTVNSLQTQIALGLDMSLRPLEIGSERALSEVVTRLETVPQTAFDETSRLLSQIGGDAQRIADNVATNIGALRDELLSTVRQVVADCSAAIAVAQERADAVHPRTVLAAGYAILRDNAGRPLTTVSAVRGSDIVQAELRDGTAKLHPDSD